MQQKSKTKAGLKAGSKTKPDLSFPLVKENFIIIGLAIVLIIIGYILMAQNSVDGFVPTVISPIMLFIGYCILIPYGILKKPKTPKASEIQPTVPAAEIQAAGNAPSAGSNIKTG